MNTTWKELLKNVISKGKSDLHSKTDRLPFLSWGRSRLQGLCRELLYGAVIGIICGISLLSFFCVFQSISNEKHLKENFPTYDSIENATRPDGLEFSVRPKGNMKQVTIAYPDTCLLFTYEVTPNYEIDWTEIDIR